MTAFFTSDQHFNHAGILKFTDRPWVNVNEMNDGIVAAWNAVVGPRDVVWVLGDFAYHSADFDMLSIFKSLRGKKNLVIGNHDEKNKSVMSLGWERIERLHTFRENGVRLELCHYPLASWKNAHNGSLMLHGHSHGNMKENVPHRFDVGIDALGAQFNHGPIPVEAIVAIAATQTFQPVDHHDL